MKILIISSGYFPITGNHGGAIENLVNQYLEYNEKIKNKIVVYSVKKGKQEDKQIYINTEFRNIDIGSLKLRIEQKLLNLINRVKETKLKRIYIKYVIKDIINKNEQNKYDLIIFENGQNYIEYFNKHVKTTTKKILHLHNDYLNCKNKNSKYIINGFNEIWVVSNFLKNQIGEVDKLALKKVKVLYNCIDYKLFKKNTSSEEKNILKNNLGINKNDFIFLYVGRLMKEKGVKELINSFCKLNKEKQNAKLLIIGGSKKQKNNDDFITEIKQISNKNVIFTGQINNTELYKYYQISNIQVVPTLCEEAFGLILLEGVASNLPIICTNSGGIPEVMNNDCIYVERKNIENNLYNAMKYSIENFKNMKLLTKDYNNIIKKFSTENYLENFQKLIKKQR